MLTRRYGTPNQSCAAVIFSDIFDGWNGIGAQEARQMADSALKISRAAHGEVVSLEQNRFDRRARHNSVYLQNAAILVRNRTDSWRLPIVMRQVGLQIIHEPCKFLLRVLDREEWNLGRNTRTFRNCLDTQRQIA